MVVVGVIYCKLNVGIYRVKWLWKPSTLSLDVHVRIVNIGRHSFGLTGEVANAFSSTSFFRSSMIITLTGDTMAHRDTWWDWVPVEERRVSLGFSLWSTGCHFSNHRISPEFSLNNVYGHVNWWLMISSLHDDCAVPFIWSCVQSLGAKPPKQENLSNEERRALKERKSDENIVIIRADCERPQHRFSWCKRSNRRHSGATILVRRATWSC